MAEPNLTIDHLEGMEPLDSISIPSEWTREKEGPSGGDRSCSINYRPASAPQVVLSVYYRGYEISEDEARPLASLLEEAAQELSPDRFYSLGHAVLANLADRSAFVLDSAETVRLNGKLVLAVEGSWKNGGKRFIGYILGADQSCTDLKEIFFEGQEPQFSRWQDQALRLMGSVTWKD